MNYLSRRGHGDSEITDKLSSQIAIIHRPMNRLLPLPIGQHVAQYPILQGGMAVEVSGANLAAAVANAGGVGVISTLGLGLNSAYFTSQSGRRPKPNQFFEANRLALIDELQKARELSPDGILGVNVIVATRNYLTLARTAAEQGANLIVTGAGLPMPLPEVLADFPEVAIVPIVSTVQAAQLLCQTWQQKYDRLPDAFVLECPKTSGGHVGVHEEELNNPAYCLQYLLPEMLDYLEHELGVFIPLIAAGGVSDQADIDKMLSLGANGVQIGTRFIATHECDADIRFKEFVLKAKPEDLVIVPSPVGVPGRALRNAFTEQAIAQSPDMDHRCIANCLESCLYRDRKQTYCLLHALNCAARGDVEQGLIFSGSKLGYGDRLVSVAELMAELTQPFAIDHPVPALQGV